jgi:hypothetical protein
MAEPGNRQAGLRLFVMGVFASMRAFADLTPAEDAALYKGGIASLFSGIAKNFKIAVGADTAAGFGSVNPNPAGFTSGCGGGFGL